MPVYSFEKHARLPKSNTIYSPHVLILEGIFALHDPRVLDMLDLKVNQKPDITLRTPKLTLSRSMRRPTQTCVFLDDV